MRTRYTIPFTRVKQQRMTVREFVDNLTDYLKEDPDLYDAIILDAGLTDDTKTTKDGAVTFELYSQERDQYGSLVVPVLSLHDPQ